MANLISLASGSSVVLTVTEQQTIVLNNDNSSKARLEITTGRGAGSVVADNHSGRKIYGPFGAGTITLSAVNGACRYELSGDTVSPLDDDSTASSTTVLGTSRTALPSDNRSTLELAASVTYSLSDAVPLPEGVAFIGPTSGSATIAVTGSATINGGTSSVTVAAGKLAAAVPRASSSSAFIVAVQA